MSVKNPLVAPVLKWVGGKRQLLDELTKYTPKGIKSYCEPFLGGGALLFHLQPREAIVNDINKELMGVYECIKNHVEELIEALQGFKNDAETFYAVRDWDRDRNAYEKRTDVEKAARILFLNKTCFNGLYRVNNAGEFNSPFGHYKNPNIVNAPILRAVHSYFATNDIHFSSVDYHDLLDKIKEGTFVYLDPPYDPVSDTASFTGYSKGGFSREDQLKLKLFCDTLDQKGVKFMLSNSSTGFIRNLYCKYRIETIQAKRNINSDPTKRGDVDELIIRNYK